MQTFRTTILVASLAALTGCASWDKSPICEKTNGWQAWNDVRCVEPTAMADPRAEMDSMAAQMAASKQRAAELERQLASRDKELADLRGTLSAEEAASNFGTSVFFAARYCEQEGTYN